MRAVVITFCPGIIDLPHEDENTMTGDIVEYLGGKYQIMQTFFDRYGNDTVNLMSKDPATNLKSMPAGAPPLRDPLAESMSRVYDLFVVFLDSEEMNGMSGMPARRALLGTPKRFKNKKGDPWISFIDTGNCQAVMHAWVSGVLNTFSE